MEIPEISSPLITEESIERSIEIKKVFMRICLAGGLYAILGIIKITSSLRVICAAPEKFKYLYHIA